MSEPKIISPLLDGFAMGGPISDHDGIQCCPAIKENSDEKYIVKIISVPASQKQMDALLLAGAYKDPADAMAYFQDQAEGIVREAETLTTLSRLEGFVPYDSWQIEPITRHRLGYQVYLVGTYKRSLDKHMRRNPVTHLEAVNLGIDMCSALAACRRAGYLYVDLKPTNIFLTKEKEFRIGDLGFVALDALKYTSLPGKYCSAYSPSELHDPMAELTETADTYALGMILYQLYNDGQLPDLTSPDELPTPINADYELAEIIMKAIHSDPAQRWSDPAQMGQALVAYMQRNSVNDTPITPHTPLAGKLEDTVFFQPIRTAGSDAPADDGSTQEESAPEADTAGEEASAVSDGQEPEQDETAPGEDTAEELQDYEMSEELSKIVAQADDLIAHETPEEVKIPEAVPAADPFAFAMEDAEIKEDVVESVVPIPEVTPRVRRERKTVDKAKLRKTVSALILLAVMAAAAAVGFWFYQTQYLQTIDSISITGDQQQLTVTVDTEVDHSLLTVVCSDTYGNSYTKSLENGQAVFSGLQSASLYKIQLQIEGFRKLVGQTSDIYTTEGITSIASFTAITGGEDGSVKLTFTVSGDEPEEWTVRCTADGAEEITESFTGHSVTVTGLTVGRTYTFTLEASEDVELSGENSLQFMASRLILAENLQVTSSDGSDMTVRWSTPGDVVVDSWNVRCYNDAGYDVELTVNDTAAHLTDIDPTTGYTIEVTAAGMTQAARTSITANPINIRSFQVDSSESGALKLSWDYSGTAPEGGWLLLYTIDGSETPGVVKCEDASALIQPQIPGARYSFEIQAADATSIFSNHHTYTCPDAQDYEGHSITAENLECFVIATPAEDWSYESVGSDAFTDSVASGESVSLVLHGTAGFYIPPDPLSILYVVRDAYGNVLPEYVAQEDGDWRELWFEGDYHFGELDLPVTPTEPGSYRVSVYFNGLFVVSANFAVTG